EVSVADDQPAALVDRLDEAPDLEVSPSAVERLIDADAPLSGARPACGEAVGRELDASAAPRVGHEADVGLLRHGAGHADPHDALDDAPRSIADPRARRVEADGPRGEREA